MIMYPIVLPSRASTAMVTETKEAVLIDANLCITMKSTLKQYPGCIHWHIQSGRNSGTLELTFWPHARQVWFSIQHGRRAPWIDTLLPELQQMLQEQLHE
ncbi:MAG: hypothetical protein SH847_03905 [Roseiflexaceae bacterium]|nr:hypothetical protein [Roseiflexaceae bacterium]